VYTEHSVETPDPYPCSGHPDLFVQHPSGKVRVLEIKTISMDGFRNTVAPQVAHVWQVQYYMWACARDPSLRIKIDPTVGYVLYLSKGVVANGLPVKMFVVQKNPRVLSEIKEKLVEYSRCMSSGKLPAPLDICVKSGFSNYVSKSCPWGDQCQENHL
jgi:hypothetical protein